MYVPIKKIELHLALLSFKYKIKDKHELFGGIPHINIDVTQAKLRSDGRLRKKVPASNSWVAALVIVLSRIESSRVGVRGGI